jgi:hypothetical protein
MPTLHKVILFTIILVISVHASPAQAKILLTVTETAGFPRTGEPVTLGVPFKKGMLQPQVSTKITTADGAAVDAQFMTMATWDDGSTKWLKCDFQADVPANGSAKYFLQLNAAHQALTELKTVESSENITVTTGPMRFIVSKKRGNLFDEVRLDLDNDGQYTDDEIIVSSGSLFAGPHVTRSGVDYYGAAEAPEQIQIEEQGPVKTVIRLSGKHYHGSNYLLKYETRIYAYAGKSYVKVRHVYANGRSVSSLSYPGDPVLGEAFDRYSLDVQPNLSGTRNISFGGDGGTPYSFSLAPGTGASLVQSDRTNTSVPLTYHIYQGTRVQASGSRSEGWGDFSDSKWGLMISNRYFWQKYPKGISLSGTGKASAGLCSSAEFLWVGMGTDDEILFYFHPPMQTAQITTIAMGTGKSPLVVRAPAQQYIDSQAYYPLLPETLTSYPAMKTYIDRVTANHLANIEELQLYGNINFGDVPRYPDEAAEFPDESVWGNNYYDGILTLTRLFASWGDSRFYEIFVPMTRHFMETDCWNTYDADDWMNGFNPGYSLYHRSIANYNAHYAEGIWYYHYLTGDERAREIGLRAADSIVNQHTWGSENVSCRTAYQLGSACLEAWKNTRKSKYLNHAKHLLVDKILATQDKYGLIGSVDVENNTVPGEQSWMMALYADTLWKYLKENPKSDWIAKFALLADFLDQYARKSPGSEEYWNAFLPPDNTQPPRPDPEDYEPTVYWSGKGLIAGAYAYAYDLTGKSKYKTLAVNLLNDIWGSGEPGGQQIWGKESNQAMKNMIHAAAIVSGTPVKTITVQSPNGGEVLPAGIVYPITWTTTGSIDKVNLYYSTATNSFVTIAEGASNTGTYSWKVPTVSSGTCLIKISDAGDTSVFDTSDAVFTIGGDGVAVIHLSRTDLAYGAAVSGEATGSQRVSIENSGSGTLNWTTASEQGWITVDPASGTGNGTVSIGLNAAGLAAGSYTGMVRVSDAAAVNSPQTVTVTLKVSNRGAAPFGSFDTPQAGAEVMSSIPVTGWVLDDIEVTGIKIWRDPLPGEGNQWIYIGDAALVEGARPDIEEAYPNYPLNYRAGWGYMMLTYGLPGSGMDNTFVIHAAAYDGEGRAVTLGSKTIYCKNRDAVKPFGTIDTPTQGGTASGSNYINFGWALTPPPNKIPVDGSTIRVYIDGAEAGQVAYNDYRPEFETLFPGYLNNIGAGGHFSIDTTAYEDGTHTVTWVVTDNAGNADGIGSRFFQVQNAGSGNRVTSAASSIRDFPSSAYPGSSVLSLIIPNAPGPVTIFKGYSENPALLKILPGDTGVIAIDIAPMERIVIRLADDEKNKRDFKYSGCMRVGKRLDRLPAGSVLDREVGVFYWQPGPGFLSEYHLVFFWKDNAGKVRQRNIVIKIVI